MRKDNLTLEINFNKINKEDKKVEFSNKKLKK